MIKLGSTNLENFEVFTIENFEVFTITSDHESVFTGRKIHDFAFEMGIKLLTLTPYYARVNG